MGKKSEDEKDKIKRLQMEISLLKSRLSGVRKPYLSTYKTKFKAPQKPPSGGQKFRSFRPKIEIGPILRDGKSPDPYHQPKPGEMTFPKGRSTEHWKPKKVDMTNTDNSYFEDDYAEQEEQPNNVIPDQEISEVSASYPNDYEIPDEDYDSYNDQDGQSWEAEPSVYDEMPEVPEGELDDPRLWGAEVETVPFEDELLQKENEFDPAFDSPIMMPPYPPNELENLVAESLVPEPEPVVEVSPHVGELQPLEPIPELQPLPEMNPLGDLPGLEPTGPGILNQGLGNPLGLNGWDDPDDGQGNNF